MRLLLIRHAESLGNQARQIQGQTQEPLTQLGRHQATQLGQFLGQLTWSPTHLYTSPLRRAQETAQIVADCVGGLDITPHPDLQEIDNGVLQGLTWTEAQQQFPDLCQRLESTPLWQPIPGAETPAQAQVRAARFVQDLLSRHANPDRILLVSHGGILPYLLAALLETPCVWGLNIPLTGMFELSLDLDHWPQRHSYGPGHGHLWQIHRFNQTPHLL
jgi:broad specificity phosphatase PhoE